MCRAGHGHLTDARDSDEQEEEAMPFDGICPPGSPLARLLEADRELTEQRRAARKPYLTPEMEARKRACRVAQARETIIILSELEELLNGGVNWIRGEFETPEGYCLVGGLRHLRKQRGRGDNASQYLRRAIAKHADRYYGIMDFNDSRRNYEQVRAVIVRARDMAARFVESDSSPLPLSALQSDLVQSEIRTVADSTV